MAKDERTRTERVADHLKGRLHPKTIGKEVLDTITDKIVPQGTAELAQAINTQGFGYVPYGSGQEPTSPQTGVHGPATPEAADSPPRATYQAVSVDEIGPPQATPSIKGVAVKSQQRDPLATAREAARENAKEVVKSKEKNIDIG